jgi:tetratricopeptide (TPR) repeat protein
MIELVCDVSNGYVRARAVVRRIVANKGMGIQFIQMRSEDRSKWNQFLLQQKQAPAEPSPQIAAVPTVPEPKRQVPEPPKAAAKPLEEPVYKVPFRDEVQQLIEVSQKGTYYELLGVNAESQANEIKKSYYALAKRFHPDHHMDEADLIRPLQALMHVVTEAYHTLRDDRNRSAYDKALVTKGAFDLARERTESQETFEVCRTRANECLRAGNFVGSISFLRKCTLLAPHDAKSHLLLARSVTTVAAYRDEAILHFQKALELDPWNTDAYFYFGQFYETLKLPWRATSLYSQLLTIDPDHARAQARLSAIEGISSKTREFNRGHMKVVEERQIDQ